MSKGAQQGDTKLKHKKEGENRREEEKQEKRTGHRSSYIDTKIT